MSLNLSTSKPTRWFQRVAHLSLRIYDLREKILILVHDFMAKCILDRGIIGIDKVAFAELNRQGRFAFFSPSTRQ